MLARLKGSEWLAAHETPEARQVLYRTPDGNLVVHERAVTGEATTFRLYCIVEEDLERGGPFEALGLQAGGQR